MTYIIGYFAVGVTLVIVCRLCGVFRNLKGDEATGWAMVLTFVWGLGIVFGVLGVFLTVVGWMLTGRWELGCE